MKTTKCLPVLGFVSLFGLIAAPLATQADLPKDGFPLGRAALPEVRTVKELRPGLTHIHVERGGGGKDGSKWSICNTGGPQQAEVLAPLRDCFERAGLTVHEYRLQETPDSEPYYMLFGGEFDTEDEARSVLADLSCEAQIGQPAIWQFWDTGPWSFDLVIVDTKQYKGEVFFAQSGTAYRMSPSEMARKHGAVVAMNASFFEYSLDDIGGVPAGVSITQGEWRHEPYPNEYRNVFIDNDAEGGPRLSIGDELPPFPVMKWANGTITALDGIDRMPRDDEIVAMRQDVAGTSNLSHVIPEHLVAASIGKDGRLFLGRRASAGPLLMATGSKKAILEEGLHSGEKVQLDLTVPGRPGLNALFVAPVFMKNGQPAEAAWSTLNDRRFARTMIGADAEGKFYLLVAHVNGLFNPPGGRGGIGATLQELSQIAQFLGLVNAANFDGGASSTMSIEGRPLPGAMDYQLSNGHGVDRPVGAVVLVKDHE